MLCPKCNAQISDTNNFCPVCGNKLSQYKQAVQSSADPSRSQKSGYDTQAPAATKKPLFWILLASGLVVIAAVVTVIIVLTNSSGSGSAMPMQPQISNNSGTTSSVKKSYLGTWETGISFTNSKSEGYGFEITADSVTCERYSAGKATIIGNFSYTVSSDGPYTRLVLSAANKQNSTVFPSDGSDADDYSTSPETTDPYSYDPTEAPSYVPVPSSAHEGWDVPPITAASHVSATRSGIDADSVVILTLINPGLMGYSFGTAGEEPDPNYEWGEYELLYRRDNGTDELPLDDSMKAECVEVLGEDFTHRYFPATKILVLGNAEGKFYQFYILVDGTAQFMERIVLTTATDLDPDAVYTDHNFIITDTQ